MKELRKAASSSLRFPLRIDSVWTTCAFSASMSVSPLRLGAVWGRGVIFAKDSFKIGSSKNVATLPVGLNRHCVPTRQYCPLEFEYRINVSSKHFRGGELGSPHGVRGQYPGANACPWSKARVDYVCVKVPVSAVVGIWIFQRWTGFQSHECLHRNPVRTSQILSQVRSEICGFVQKEKIRRPIQQHVREKPQ